MTDKAKTPPSPPQTTSQTQSYGTERIKNSEDHPKNVPAPKPSQTTSYGTETLKKSEDGGKTPPAKPPQKR